MKSTSEILELFDILHKKDGLEIGEVENFAIAAGERCYDMCEETVNILSHDHLTRRNYVNTFATLNDISKLKEGIEWAEHMLKNTSKNLGIVDNPLANRIKEAAKLANEKAFKARAAYDLVKQTCEAVGIVTEQK